MMHTCMRAARQKKRTVHIDLSDVKSSFIKYTNLQRLELWMFHKLEYDVHVDVLMTSAEWLYRCGFKEV